MVRQAHHPEPSRRVNSKIQYTMTKILTAVGLYRLAVFAPLVIMPFSTTEDRSVVWNFEFGSLEFF